ncbi:MAG TPA: tetratricopeptide repeat protein [Casimicrobiaceae bacterium]|nr:tetratricopeptide repeat protein [Casimicrobiaceae bacterium]
MFGVDVTPEPQLLDLVPIEPKSDQPPAVSDGAASKPAAPEIAHIEITDVSARPPAPIGDQFAIAAKVEFEKGQLDQALWDRAMSQSKGDRVAAIALYLNARATSLRVRDRERRGHERVIVSASTSPSRRAADALVTDEPEEFVPTPVSRFDPRIAVALFAACAIIVAGAGYYFLGGNASKPAQAVGSAPAAPAVSPPATRAETTKSVAKAAALEADQRAIAALVAKIDLLRSAGNWNVHVLHAGEWTRKEPKNAAAWNELGIGYEKLKQFDDAYVAAHKAVELAPGNALYWRNLGLLDVELNLPDEALRAFGEAVAANDQDIQSLVQIGLLNVRLGRVAEAKVILDRALVANADDANTQCLKTLVARGAPLPKATVPVGRQVEAPLKAMCREPAETPAAPPAASPSAAPPKAPARGKR